MNRNEVIDVLTAVAAADRRTVGEADVTVWCAVIGDLPKEDALRAVVDHFRECPGVWLEPGHVVAGVRAIRRDRMQRLSEDQQAAREAVIDAKVSEMVAEIAAAKSIPDDRVVFHRPGVNALLVRCPWCHAAVGDRCMTPGTQRPNRNPHPSRVDAAKEVHA